MSAQDQTDLETARDNRDYVWGATKAAVVMFRVKESDKDFKTFRRRLFRTYEHWKACYFEALHKGRPLPVNPGFVIIPGCAQIILSRSAHSSYIEAQRGGRL